MKRFLRSYPSGPSDNPSYREYYTQWKALPPGSAREEAMNKVYYELAVHNPGAVAWYCALKLEVADLYIEKAWENHQGTGSAIDFTARLCQLECCRKTSRY